MTRSTASLIWTRRGALAGAATGAALVISGDFVRRLGFVIYPVALGVVFAMVGAATRSNRGGREGIGGAAFGMLAGAVGGLLSAGCLFPFILVSWLVGLHGLPSLLVASIVAGILGGLVAGAMLGLTQEDSTKPLQAEVTPWKFSLQTLLWGVTLAGIAMGIFVYDQQLALVYLMLLAPSAMVLLTVAIRRKRHGWAFPVRDRAALLAVSAALSLLGWSLLYLLIPNPGH